MNKPAATVVAPPPLLQDLPPRAEVTSRGLKGLATFPTPSFFTFSPFWEPNIKDKDIKKQLQMQGKLLIETDHACPEMT